jgi:uncharacterized protein YndB with AHSA1/START domain
VQKESVPEPRDKDEEVGRTGMFQQPEFITRSHRETVDLSARMEDVWEAITNIDSLKEWLATDGEFAPHIGGHFSLALRDGTDMQGRIDIFLPPRRMRLVVALREGEDLLASGPTTVELVLYKVKKKTRLSVSVAGIPATEEWQEDYRRSEDRWKNGLVELKEFLSSN